MTVKRTKNRKQRRAAYPAFDAWIKHWAAIAAARRAV